MGDTHKKYSGRRSYLNDFRRSVGGEYIYTGAVYAWASPRTPALWRLWGFGLGAFAAALAAGCIPHAGVEKSAWVLLPCAAQLILAGMALWQVYELTDAGERVREYTFKKSVGRLPGLGLAGAVCAAAAALAETVQLFGANFAGSRAAGAVTVLVLCTGTVCSLLLRREIKRLQWARQEGEGKTAQEQ